MLRGEDVELAHGAHQRVLDDVLGIEMLARPDRQTAMCPAAQARQITGAQLVTGGLVAILCPRQQLDRRMRIRSTQRERKRRHRAGPGVRHNWGRLPNHSAWAAGQYDQTSRHLINTADGPSRRMRSSRRSRRIQHEIFRTWTRSYPTRSERAKRVRHANGARRPESERAVASEPRERSAPTKRRARECVGESEGRSPSDKTRVVVSPGRPRPPGPAVADRGGLSRRTRTPLRRLRKSPGSRRVRAAACVPRDSAPAWSAAAAELSTITTSIGRPSTSPIRRTASPAVNPHMPRPSVSRFATRTIGPGTPRTASGAPRTRRIGIRLV